MVLVLLLLTAWMLQLVGPEALAVPVSWEEMEEFLELGVVVAIGYAVRCSSLSSVSSLPASCSTMW